MGSGFGFWFRPVKLSTMFDFLVVNVVFLKITKIFFHINIFGIIYFSDGLRILI